MAAKKMGQRVSAGQRARSGPKARAATRGARTAQQEHEARTLAATAAAAARGEKEPPSHDSGAAARDLFVAGHSTGHVHPTLHAVERLEGLRNPKTTDARLRELLQDAHERLEAADGEVEKAQADATLAGEAMDIAKERCNELEAEAKDAKHAAVMELTEALGRAEKAEAALKMAASPIGPAAHMDAMAEADAQRSAAVAGHELQKAKTEVAFLKSDLSVSRNEVTEMRATLARERELSGGTHRRAVDAEAAVKAAEDKWHKLAHESDHDRDELVNKLREAEAARDAAIEAGADVVAADGEKGAEFERLEAALTRAEKRAAELQEVEPLATAFAVIVGSKAFEPSMFGLDAEGYTFVLAGLKLLGRL